MTLLHRLASILRWLVNRARAEQGVSDELEAFIDICAAEKMRAGVPPARARRLAMLELGGIEQAKERVRTYRHGARLDEIGRDVRYAVRTIRRSPGFAALAVVSLALGIGANTAIFTLIDTVMLRELPVRAPGQLVAVGDRSRPTAVWEGAPMVDVLSYPLYKRLRDQNRVFTGLLASGKAGRLEMGLDASPPEPVRGRLVSGNYFDVLGVTPVLGRTFTSDDDRAPGGRPVIVISYDFWEKRFARDPGILGRTIRLNGSTPFTVIGVGPRGFTGEVVGSPADIWIPLTMQPQLSPSRLNRVDFNWLLGLGRLAPGISLAQARAELTMLAQQALADFEGPKLSAENAREIRAKKLPVEPGGQGFSWIRKNVSPTLFLLMAVVGLVLLIACANLASLLFARAISRQREISVRLAMGASRGRLVRQLLTEGAVLAMIGGAAGLLAAGWASRLFTQLASRGGLNPIPFDVDVRPDVAVLGFTAAVSALTAVLCALVPAVRSTRVNLAPALKEHPRGSEMGGWSFGKLLVVGQVALSVPLLITAGLLVRTLAHLERVDVGYSPNNLVLMNAEVTGSGAVPAAQRLLWARQLIERLRSVPGVLGVTVSENGLFTGTDSSGPLQIEGFQPSRREDTSSRFDQVGARYFHTLGIPLLAGREFDEQDTTGTPLVAVVNETMARFYFGNRSPLGKFIQNGGDRYTIVGVVKDNRQRELKGRPERRFYIALFQTVDRLGAFNFAIKTGAAEASMIPTIRREVLGFQSNLRVSSIESVSALMSETLSGERSTAYLSGLFGMLALLLTVVGSYGVTSYATSRRTGEIGVRMALGADRWTVIRMVVRDALTPMAAGLALGIPAAFVASRLTSANLAGVSSIDPLVVGATLLLMLFAGLCAGLVPAIRASHIDPARALRQE